MARMNKDVEDFHRETEYLFDDSDASVSELFEECKGDSKSGKSVAYGDRGAGYGEWLWLPKSMIDDGRIKVRKLSNGFEVIMPKWFANKNGLG